MAQTYTVTINGHTFWEDDLTGFDAERVMAHVGNQTLTAFHRFNPKSAIAQWACFWMKVHPDTTWEQALDEANRRSFAWLQRQFVPAEDDDRPGNYTDGVPDPPKGGRGTDS
jgi:hypothetical protein